MYLLLAERCTSPLKSSGICMSVWRANAKVMQLDCCLLSACSPGALPEQTRWRLVGGERAAGYGTWLNVEHVIPSLRLSSRMVVAHGYPGLLPPERKPLHLTPIWHMPASTWKVTTPQATGPPLHICSIWHCGYADIDMQNIWLETWTDHILCW